MSEKNETIPDIVAEIRRLNPEKYRCSPYSFEIEPDEMRSYADRIEAAYKRIAMTTPGQWMEIAQQGGEIARLRKALEPIRKAAVQLDSCNGTRECAAAMANAIAATRKALEDIDRYRKRRGRALDAT